MTYDKIIYGTVGTLGVSYAAYKIKFPWVKYDIQLIRTVKGIGKKRQEEMENNDFSIKKFETWVEKFPKKPFIIFEDNIYTYQFVNEQANRVANLARKWNIGIGDCVALFIENEPAFVWTFLGLQKIGVTCALINYNLRSKALFHCIAKANAKILIVGSGIELLQAVEDLRDELAGVQIFVQGRESKKLDPRYHAHDELLRKTLPVQVDPSVRAALTMEDISCYIYTSGTTGLPKPVIIKQYKTVGFGKVLQLGSLNENDAVYTPLPLYHSAGGGVGLFGTIDAGCTLILRKKFSASHFWEDVRRYNVTVIQYIGEMCRYLLSVPKSPLDGVHKVRVAVGNGLRADIWEKFVQRFKLPLIVEFFGATEGHTLLVNMFNKPGAIGRLSPILQMLAPDRPVLVKFDVTTAMPVRDKNGRCIEIKCGEVGLFMCEMPTSYLEKPTKLYSDLPEVTEKKLVRNAFKEGDAYLNYGDIFSLDHDYFIYFVDRLGDTFRWKGENVSTTEVANVLCCLDFIEDANVYGVEIPGHDGRAGMGALTLMPGSDMTPENRQHLYKVCEEQLPPYARPVFIRLIEEAHLTGTFKQNKVNLSKEGYDLAIVKDPLFYLDVDRKTYSPLDSTALQLLLSRAKL